LAVEAQLLTESMVVATTKSISSSNDAIRDKVGGFKITERPIPVKFEVGKFALTREGKQSAKHLAT